MCRKLWLNARDSGRFARLLHICRNYTLHTLCCEPHNVCNDEGKSIGLRLNRAIYADEERNEIMDIIAGDFFVAFAPDDEGYRSLPDNLAHKYYGLFRYPEAFICAGNSIHVARIEN